MMSWPISVSYLPLKGILLHHQPHSGYRSKNLWFLLIRSIQTYPICFEAFEHDFVDREVREWPMLVQYPLKEFCSTSWRTQDTAHKTFAFCWLGLFKHTPFDLKHSGVISLIWTNVLAHFSTVPLKGCFLCNRPHSGYRSKNLRILLIKSFQTYGIWLEAFKHDFVDREVREWLMSVLYPLKP